MAVGLHLLLLVLLLLVLMLLLLLLLLQAPQGSHEPRLNRGGWYFVGQGGGG